MTDTEPGRRREALDWARRIHDPTFTDWSAHIEWLERSPENARAFDDASLDIEAASAGLSSRRKAERPPQAPANDDSPHARSRRGRRFPSAILGGALAAGVVGGIATWKFAAEPDASYVLRTGPGATRSIALADGTRVSLNGDTVVRFHRGSTRLVELERGEALFAVAHDPRSAFTLLVGDAVVRDVGTVFDVVRSGGRTEVGVREGSVDFESSGATVRLAAGDTLRSGGSDVAVARRVPPEAVGGWRRGRLAYTQASMTDVAEDLSRATGESFTVDPVLADRRFSGVISTGGAGKAVARRVEAVTGLSLDRVGGGWRITSPRR